MQDHLSKVDLTLIVSEPWPGIGYTAEGIYKMVTDWFLKAGVHFAVVENIQITLNTLDRITTVFHKTSLRALPSSPVNRPKGREGILRKHHIIRTQIPLPFFSPAEGRAAAQNMDCWQHRATGHTKTPRSSNSVHQLLLMATSKPQVCKTGLSGCYWTERHCPPCQVSAGRKQMWHWHVCAGKGRKGLGKKNCSATPFLWRARRQQALEACHHLELLPGHGGFAPA